MCLRILAAYLLSHKEYDDLHWLDPYRAGGSRSDNPNVNFFWDFFSQGKPGYTAGSKKTAAEIIDLIHATGGEAVVAHPGANFKGKDEILERLLDAACRAWRSTAAITARNRPVITGSWRWLTDSG